MERRRAVQSRLIAVAVLVVSTGSWTAPSSQDPPCTPNATHDMCDTVGHASGFLHKGVSAFVAKLQTGKFKPSPLPGGDPNCTVQIAPVTGSANTPVTSETDDRHSYVVAIIKNPNGCKAAKFDLGTGDSAAWIVTFKYKPDAQGHMPGRYSSIGTSRIVGLGTGFLGLWDSPLSGDDKWLFTHCAPVPPSEPPYLDNALFYTHAQLCTDVDTLRHDATRVAAALAVRLRQAPRGTQTTPGARPASDDDPALWFRCGGDCCYSDSYYY